MQNLLKRKSILFFGLIVFLSLNTFSQNDPNGLTRLIEEITKETDNNVALQKADRLVNMAPDFAHGFVLRGTVYFKMENYNKTVADMSRALALGVEDKNLEITVYKLRGLANHNIGDYRGAIADLTRSIEYNGNDFRDYSIRSQAYRKIGENDKADADERKVSELQNNAQKKPVDSPQADFMALVNKAGQDFEEGKYADAINGFTRIINMLGDDENVYAIYFSRGRAYFELENYPAAFSDYNKVISLRPDLPNAYTFRGEVYLVEDKLDLAIKDFDKALSIDPKEILALRRRGEAYYLKRDFDKTITDMDSVLRLDSKFTSAWYWRADAYFEKGNFKKALSDINEFLKLDSETSEAYKFRAKVYRKLNKNKEALADEEKASELDQ